MDLLFAVMSSPCRQMTCKLCWLSIWDDMFIYLFLKLLFWLTLLQVVDEQITHWQSNLDGLFRWPRPLLVILGLFVFFAACWQVGVIGQTAEQRWHHWTGVHLLLWNIHTKPVAVRTGFPFSVYFIYRDLKSIHTSNRAIFLPSYCWLFSASLAALLLMKGLLSLGFPSPVMQKHQLTFRVGESSPIQLHIHTRKISKGVFKEVHWYRWDMKRATQHGAK